MDDGKQELWLCMSGGNALGSFHAGAYEALEDAAMIPSRIAGASIGALMGALIAGNAPEDRLHRLRQFWKKAEQHHSFLPILPSATPSLDKWLSLSQTLAHGRPGLFHPALRALWSVLPGVPSPPHLFDTSPLRETLIDLIDFGRLTAGPVQLLVTAVDVETGEDVVFDSHAGGINVDHLMASTAFPIAFAPVTIGGRVYVDAGVSTNLPVTPLFADSDGENVMCLALDLVSAVGRAPNSLDDAVGRAHDLIFASQSRHALRELMLSQPASPSGGAAIIHLAYGGEDQEIGGKSLDFSRSSIRQRWAAGKAGVEDVLRQRPQFRLSRGRTIYRQTDGSFVTLSP